jgi:hypothetical protein
MSVALGAHVLIQNGDGHNSAAGGSYHVMGGSYNFIGSGGGCFVGIRDSGSTDLFVNGRGIRSDGNYGAAFGIGHDVQGARVNAFGRGHVVDEIDGVTVLGSFGKGYAPGEVVLANGGSADNVGRHDFRKGILRRETTDATVSSMRVDGGGTSVSFPNNAAATLSVKVVGVLSDGTKMASWEGSFGLDKFSDTLSIDGSTSDVALTTIYSKGSPTWSAAVRGIAGKLVVRVTGATGEDVTWSCSYEITQVSL